MKKIIDRFCESRLARHNRGCEIVCNFMKKGWLYGARIMTSKTDLYTAEYLDNQRFRNY